MARLKHNEITFGYYKGRNQVGEPAPDSHAKHMRARAAEPDRCYQGDTEFASVEQQRYLFESAPSDYDRSCLTRVMIEEMRDSGWQDVRAAH